MKVICNKANEFQGCVGCKHSDDHEMGYYDYLGKKCKCTEWGECAATNVHDALWKKVRCIKVKKNESKDK